MGEPTLTFHLPSEPLLLERAGAIARTWTAADLSPLIVGLRGGLGAGKTTWVRGMLRGLGYAGRVPSPTYTLVEHYGVDRLDVVHVDLYRLSASEEIEALGVRDWLSAPRAWLLIEWPERVPALEARCDLTLTLVEDGPGRVVHLAARTARGSAALWAIDHDPE